MIQSGDWVVPVYQGKPWMEKPPLLYWASAGSIALFGDDWGPRLPSVLASMATLMLVGLWARRRISHEAGYLVMVVLGTSLLFAGVGRMMMTDALFTFGLTGAVLAFWESLQGRPSWRLAGGVMLGLAVLAKTPVAVAFVVAILGLVAWRAPSVRTGFRGIGWWLGAGLALAGVVAIWYVPAWLSARDVFVAKYLIEQNLQRFAGGDKAHGVWLVLHPFYFALVVLLAFLAWLPWFRAGWRARPKDEDQTFVLIWGLFIVGFFTLSGSKLPHYILPAFPPLAIAVARALVQVRPYAAWRRVALVSSLSVFALVNAAFLTWYSATHADLHRLAIALAKEKRPVVLWRITPPPKESAIQLRLNDTSHPSLYFYLPSGSYEAQTEADFAPVPEGTAILGRTQVGPPRDPAGRWVAVPDQPDGVSDDRFQVFRKLNRQRETVR